MKNFLFSMVLVMGAGIPYTSGADDNLNERGWQWHDSGNQLNEAKTGNLNDYSNNEEDPFADLIAEINKKFDEEDASGKAKDSEASACEEMGCDCAAAEKGQSIAPICYDKIYPCCDGEMPDHIKRKSDADILKNIVNDIKTGITKIKSPNKNSINQPPAFTEITCKKPVGSDAIYCTENDGTTKYVPVGRVNSKQKPTSSNPNFGENNPFFPGDYEEPNVSRTNKEDPGSEVSPKIEKNASSAQGAN